MELKMMPVVYFKRLHPGAFIPKYQTLGSAGMDLHSIDSELITPGKRVLIRTGISIKIPEGFEGQVRSRSGLAIKHGISVLNSPGTIDFDYRGEVCVILINHSAHSYYVTAGERIAQLVIAPVARAWSVEENTLDETGRGSGGFGSTGK